MAQTKLLSDILKKTKKNSEAIDQLKVLIEDYRNQADWVRQERMPRYSNAWDTYLRKLPAPKEYGPMAGTYVEPVLYEAVQSVIPSLMNIFTENDSQAVAFRMKGFHSDPNIESAINETINRLFLRENNGYKVLEDAIKESLITEGAFIKYFIEEENQKDSHVIQDWTPLSTVIGSTLDWVPVLPSTIGNKTGEWQGLEWKHIKVPVPINAMADGPEMEGLNAELPDVLIKGKLQLKRVVKRLKVHNVEFADIFVNTRCGSNFKDCRYLGHRMEITVGQAIDMGYDEETIKAAGTVSRLDDTPLDKARVIIDYENPGLSSDLLEDYNYAADPLERVIYLWEHYLYTSIPTNGKKSKLYQVTATDNDILDIREINRIPFVHGQMETVPGSFWGHSLYDLCKPYQDHLTAMVRQLEQSAMNANFPRYLAVKGQYDRKTLMNNRPGAIIEQMAPGSVDVFPYHPLPPGIVESMESIRNSKNEVLTGAAGAITTPDGAPEIAAATAAMTIANEEMKDKVIAKCIGETLVRPLYEGIYELLRAEEYHVVMPDGSVLMPDQFPEVYEFDIDINTVNDTAIRNQQLQAVLGALATLQQEAGMKILSPTAGIQVGTEILSSLGFNPAQYLITPEEISDPAEQQHQTLLKAFEIANLQEDLDTKKAQKGAINAQNGLAEAQLRELLAEGKSKRQQREDETLAKFKEVASKQLTANATMLKAKDNHAATSVEIASAAQGNPANITGI